MTRTIKNPTRISPKPVAASARPQGGRPAKISQEMILDVARRIPAHQLTMPGIALQLGVNAAALYYHFESREALLTALCAQLESTFQQRPADPRHWQRWMQATAQDLHRLMLDNPVISSAQDWGRISRITVPMLEAALETLEGAGYSAQEAVHIWNVVSNFACANAVQSRYTPQFADARERHRIVEDWITSGGGKAPRTHAALTALENVDPAGFFSESLGWLLASLPSPKSKPRRAGVKRP